MKRLSDDEMTLVGPSFPFHDLIAEMQQEIRTRCVPSLCSMLAMTCKEEYKRASVEDRTSVLFRLAYEGDPNAHLRKVIVCRPKFGMRPEILCSNPSNEKNLWQHAREAHDLVHEALRGHQKWPPNYHWHLLQWLLIDKHFKGNTCAETCIPLVVRTNDFELVKQMVLDRATTDPFTSNTVTREALLTNNVPLLKFLEKADILSRPDPLLPLGFLNALDCLDALRWFVQLLIYPNTSLVVVTLQFLIKSMISRHWNWDPLTRFLADEMRTWHAVPLGWALVPTDAIMHLAIEYRNVSILEGIWPDYCECTRRRRNALTFRGIVTKLEELNDKALVRRLLAPKMLESITMDTELEALVKRLRA